MENRKSIFTDRLFSVLLSVSGRAGVRSKGVRGDIASWWGKHGRDLCSRQPHACPEAARGDRHTKHGWKRAACGPETAERKPTNKRCEGMDTL